MLAGPCRVRILLTATATLELFTFFFCHAALTAFQGSVAYLYLLMQRREDCPRVSVCKCFAERLWLGEAREGAAAASTSSALTVTPAGSASKAPIPPRTAQKL